MRLDEHRSQTRVPGGAREFEIIEAAAVDIRSAMHVQIYGSLEVVG